MNFSKKLFTGFTATAVGISLIAGGFSVLAANDILTSGGEPVKNNKSQGTSEQAAEEKTTKKEYKTEAEITARINELKGTEAYRAYAYAQSEMVKAINLDELKPKLEKLVGKTLVHNTIANKTYTIKDVDIQSLIPQIEGLISGVKTAKDFNDWEEKTKNWTPKDPDDKKYFGDLLKLAQSIKKQVEERDNAAVSAKLELDEIKALEAKLAELKKANKDTDNKSSDNKNSDSKKQETKAKETNKNQKSSNGTNSATATKKADATKIKTGVE